MTFTYTRTNLISDINRKVHNKQGLFIDINATCNEAVREGLKETDLRTSRRRAVLAPNLFSGEYDYSCPSDLKSYSIIDIPQQAKREDGEFQLVPSQQFAINKHSGDIAIDDYNGARVLKINSKVQDKTIVVSDLDSETSGGGTWSEIGGADGLQPDTDDYVKGNGALKFDITSGTATAGIRNTTLNAFDVSDYLGGNGAFFLWVKINSVTDITNFTIKFGTDTSNFYTKSVTTQNDGTAFVSGWNLLRFDLTSLTTTGSPTNTSCRYVDIYMVKDLGKPSETDYKVDYLVLKTGKNAYIQYYSKYGWQSTTGTYKENSTSGSDYLVADTDEYDLIVAKAVTIAKRELNYPQADIDDADKIYVDKRKDYMMKNPSEAKVMGYDYYNY